jgi:hypothetical protein
MMMMMIAVFELVDHEDECSVIIIIRTGIVL